jgi:hypothetical protein
LGKVHGSSAVGPGTFVFKRKSRDRQFVCPEDMMVY